MRLTELNPNWVGHGGEGVSDKSGKAIPYQHGVGITFDCPCGCESRCFAGFSNPLDGGAAVDGGGPKWDRAGETFETLTLKPSIERKDPDGCGWHGYITDGEMVKA